MTVTDVAYTALAKNTGTLTPAGTTLIVGATDYMRVVDAVPERTILEVSNTDDDTNLTFTLVAGTNPPALRAGQGNFTATIAFGTSQLIGPFESDKYLQSDGTLKFYASVATGKVIAWQIPRGSA